MLNYNYLKLKREEESSASSEYLHVRFLGHVIRLASLPSYAYPVTCLRIVRAVTVFDFCELIRGCSLIAKIAIGSTHSDMLLAISWRLE
jgi:hypothetical protein